MDKSVKKLKLTFCSGANTVTGANFLLEEEGSSKKFLFDCGLIQGEKISDKENWNLFSYKANEIDALFVSHAHIDHIGRIPKLIHEGFNGKIYSTSATKDLTLPMLEDTANIVSKNKEFDLEKIYSSENIKKAMDLWHTADYGEKISEFEDFSFSFKNSGHILGSAMTEVIYNNKKIVFTGDLGNSPSPILPDCEQITDADYLIMESVYGDRNHESRNERKKMLEETIEDNVKRKGVLMIPTFSLERTQEFLFEIDDLVENNRIPMVPFFLDSPLAIRLTDVYRKHQDFLNEKAKKMIEKGDDIFVFPGLHQTPEAEQSKEILKNPNPKIIIAGSGMSSGGRIIHHEKNYLSDPNNTILLTGYQSPGTLGRMIEEGAKSVRIYGEDIPVRAKVSKIVGYSGHKDSDHLLDFVQSTGETVKKVFTVMGEPKSEMFLVQKLRDYLGISAYAPNTGESVYLDC